MGRSLEIKKKNVAIEIIRSGEAIAAQIKAGQKMKQSKQDAQSKMGTKSQLPSRMACKLCGFISSTEICKACVLLKGLNMGKPKMAVTGKIDMTDELSSKVSACGIDDKNNKQCCTVGKNSKNST